MVFPKKKTESGQQLVFKRRAGLFVFDFSFLIEKRTCYVDTHAESTVLVDEQMYLRRQVAHAKLARTLVRRLAFGHHQSCLEC